MLTDIERFKALPQTAQDSILEKRRDWNVGHDWWDSVYEQFIEKMKEEGIEVLTKTVRAYRGNNYETPAIYFSGFSSQGDGACFEGRVDDWDIVLRKQDFPLLLKHFDEFTCMQLRWYSSGNYCHENTLSFNDDYVELVEPGDVSALRRIALEQLHKELTLEWERFKEHFKEVVKSHCRSLYEDLEEEHVHLTSDEAILESLSTNDMLDELIKEYENEELESA